MVLNGIKKMKILIDEIVSKIEKSNGVTDFDFILYGYSIKYFSDRRFVCDLGFEFPDRPKHYQELAPDFKSVVLVENKRMATCLNIDEFFYKQTTPERLIATDIERGFLSSVVTEYTKIPEGEETKLETERLKDELKNFFGQILEYKQKQQKHEFNNI
jgi:hypothetical protein